MRINDLTVTAPLTLGGDYSEAEVLGASVWLWMHSPTHCNAPLHTLPAILMPAIKNQLFILISRANKPVAYLSLAWLNEQAERRYLTEAFVMMRPEDWLSGDRLWIFDCIAPFGDMAQVRKIVFDLVLPDHFGRMLRHRADERGMKVLTWYGRNADRLQGQKWFEQHPPQFDSQAIRTNTSLYDSSKQ
jgi:cytolysin-activating lysine-acyltransferase